MKIGEIIFYNWHEDGGGKIKRTEQGYCLYYIPIYGGHPQFIETYNTLEEAKNEADKWT